MKMWKDLPEYVLWRLAGWAFRIIPATAQAIAIDAIRWMLSRVIKYRKRIVLTQLRACFPGAAAAEISSISHKFYTHLARLVYGSLTDYLHTKSVHEFVDLQIIRKALTKHRCVFILTGHLGIWEKNMADFKKRVKVPVIGIYKPLRNKYIDRHILKKREKSGIILLQIPEFLRILNADKEPSIVISMADQYPGIKKRVHRTRFFGLETAFDTSLFRIARDRGIPVFYGMIHPKGSRRFEVEFREIEMHPGDSTIGIMVDRYAAFLEENVRIAPELWLWSHRRWK